MNGEILLAANLIILGPRPSRPVALDGSKIRIYDKTWSEVINGMLKETLSGTLLFTNAWSLLTSRSFESVSVSSRSCAIDVKNSLNLTAIELESV